MSIRWKKNLTFRKDPDSVLDYVMDYTDWLPTGDTIDSHTVTVDSGITLDSSSNTTTAVTAWLSGGTAGNVYSITYQAVTSGGRTIDRTIRIKVENK